VAKYESGRSGLAFTHSFTELQGDLTNNFLTSDFGPTNPKSFMFVRLEVLTLVTVKNVVFWDVTPCSLVEIYGGMLAA
jgi:hypothetical protein